MKRVKEIQINIDMKKYSYPQKILKINGKKFPRLPNESRSQYIERYFKAGGK